MCKQTNQCICAWCQLVQYIVQHLMLVSSKIRVFIIKDMIDEIYIKKII